MNVKITAKSYTGFLLTLGIGMLPVYLFASGGIQPSHAVLAIFAVTLLFYNGYATTYWSIALAGLALYSFTVEALYISAGDAPRSAIHSAYFFYNAVLASAVYQYVRHEGLAPVFRGTLVALIIVLGTVMIAGVDLRELDESGRETSTFNNPNQLGYFSVCLLSISYLFHQYRVINTWIYSSLLIASVFLAILSLSKAAIIANAVVIIFAIKVLLPRKVFMGWFISIFFILAVIYYAVQAGMLDEYLFTQRLSNMANEADSSLVSRGYLAFLEGNILQMLFGLGSQNTLDIVGHEVHSTFASIFNKYGLIGFILIFSIFTIWSLRLLRYSGIISVVCIIGPPFLYGITHNGTRFTLFWIVFAASMGIMARYRH